MITCRNCTLVGQVLYIRCTKSRLCGDVETLIIHQLNATKSQYNRMALSINADLQTLMRGRFKMTHFRNAGLASTLYACAYLVPKTIYIPAKNAATNVNKDYQATLSRLPLSIFFSHIAFRQSLVSHKLFRNAFQKEKRRKKISNRPNDRPVRCELLRCCQ